MTQLPAAFTERTRLLMGDERFGRYLQSFEDEPPVSVRLNPSKARELEVADGEQVPWCRGGYYLRKRPNFTMDPLLHAGCYYVQEAASMFLDEVLRQLAVSNWPLAISQKPKALDLCAAPGGKSTLLRAALPKDCVLYSNEPMRQRASILLENVTKWGYDNHIVTNNYPRDYCKAKMTFDLILCDVPCSGEGMFRKDEATIREWSEQNVEKCWRLQRDIVSDAWQCLNVGGLLIYSTCTFNTKENEENIRYFLEQHDDMEAVSIDTRPEWNITGSLLEDFHEPVYRFIPGITRSEGLFVCVLRKGGRPSEGSRKQTASFITGNSRFAVMKLGVSLLETPALHVDGPCVELTYQQAIAYLRRESLTLPPDSPRGIVEVCFQGHRLGTVKNLGNRANNLYPKEWRIKSTHIPNDYVPVLA